MEQIKHSGIPVKKKLQLNNTAAQLSVNIANVQRLSAMKRLIILFILFLVVGLAGFAQNKEYQVTAIAFYNLENLFDTINDPNNKGDDEFTPAGEYHYTEKIYNEKLHNLAKVLSQLAIETTPDGPAIIGCAEVENDKVLQDLIVQPELKNRNYKYVHFDSPDARGIDVALLYNPKYFRVLGAKSLTVQLSGTGGKETTRDVLYVTGILSGDTIHVFVNHWPSRRGGEAESAPKRALAAGVAKGVIDSLMKLNPHSRIFLMGDLNDDPVNASVAKVIGAKGDIKSLSQTDMYNPFYKYYQEGIGTLAYEDKWNLFDQIMMSDEVVQQKKNHWSYYHAEVFNRDFLKVKTGQYKGYPHRSFSWNKWINGYSDHFPTIIYLVKKDE